MMEMSNFEKLMVEHILRSPAPGRHAARSSLRHLERAWTLIDQMPEVSVFLAITAEEESASALFYSLKRHGYPGAEFLNPKNHVHKTALHPFLLATGRVATHVTSTTKPRLVFDQKNSPDGEEYLRLLVNLTDPSGEERWVMPLPPLEFTISIGGVVHDFAPELQALAAEKNVNSIQKYVKKLANRRNKVLYSDSNGIPHIEAALSFFQYRRAVVFSHLMAYLLVDPYRKRQLFAQQALSAFVPILRQLRDDADN